MKPPARRVDLLVVVLVGGLVAALGIGAYKLISLHYASKPAPSAIGSAGGDNSHELRLVPAEAYMRTYLELFGGLAPLDVQQKARGPENLFDTWDDYLASLGLPDYKVDVPRQTESNALMVATFERLGVALCNRAVEHDLKGSLPVEKRTVFAFDLPKGSLDQAGFDTRFDILHRTFLGYPAKLAPTDRSSRFFKLYQDVAGDKEGVDAHSKFTPEERGWAAVCYGLVRHPEFQLY